MIIAAATISAIAATTPQENGVPSSSTVSPLTFQQFRQSCDVHRNTARFVLREHLRLHRLGIVRPAVDVGERLAVGVADHVAAGDLLGSPWGGQAANRDLGCCGVLRS